MEINVIVNQLVILFLLICLGYGLRKAKIMGDTLDSGITKLIIYCTMPAMVLNSVISRTGEKDVSLVIELIIIAFAMYTILPLIAFVITKLLRIDKSIQGIYQYLLIFANVGFMGFPLVSAIFGPDSILYAGIFNMFFNLLAYSYGVIIVSNDSASEGAGFKLNAKTLLTPGISVSVLALVLFFLDVRVPSMIGEAVNYVGSVTTPLAMMIIGSTLAKMNPKEVFTDIRVYVYVIVRSILIPLALFPLIKFLIKDTFSLQITFIMLAMPAASTSVLYAKEYGSDESFAARCVFLSTLLSVLTIPLLLIICF
ncbi:MAG: AEC family transporter [Lachnospiraceae bacterium]|jgi:hypothetical protein|nr:AEC family transporter [Lachnospiraceae bacterium]